MILNMAIVKRQLLKANIIQIILFKKETNYLVSFFLIQNDKDNLSIF